MRIALVNNIYVDQLGYFYISSVLKKAGHDVRFFVLSAKLERQLKAFSPDLVGLTAVTGNHLWATSFSNYLREIFPDVKQILGGPHATYYPEIIRVSSFDFICRGEGEVPIVELCTALENNGDTTNIKGIWANIGGVVHENEFADQIEDLDSIPFPDRSLYDNFVLAKRNLFPYLLSSRGCPFKCTFCYAPTLFELTKDKGKFVRFRSVDNVIAEALEIKQQFKVHSFEFADDIFGMHKPWLREFSQKWSEAVRTPFQCNLRADLITEETVELLGDAGCQMIAFGLESGNEKIRNEILQKEVKTDQIKLAARLLHRRNIKIMTYNVLGSPTETFKETLETLKMNQDIKPHYAWASLMQPYPGTRIYEIAKDLGSPTVEYDSLGSSYHQTTGIAGSDRNRIANLQKLFNIAVLYPRLTGTILVLSKLPENLFFYLVFLYSHATYLIRIKKMPLGFLVHLFINVGELWRRHKSNLYSRKLPKEASPGLKQRVESGAIS